MDWISEDIHYLLTKTFHVFFGSSFQRTLHKTWEDIMFVTDASWVRLDFLPRLDVSNVEGTQHIKNSSCEQHTSGCCAVGLCVHLLFACQVVVYDAEKTTSKYHVIVCLTSCVHWGELSTWHSFDAQIIQGETLCIPEKFGGDRKLYVEVLRMCVCACRRSGVTIGGAIESRPHPHPETLYYQSFHQMWCIFQIWFVSVTGNTSVHSSGSYVLKGILRLFRFIFNLRLCFNQNIREIIYT